MSKIMYRMTDYNDQNETFNSEHGILAEGIDLWHKAELLKDSFKMGDLNDGDILVATTVGSPGEESEGWYANTRLVRTLSTSAIRGFIVEESDDDDDETIEGYGLEIVHAYPWE